MKDLCARLPYGVKVNFKNGIHTINALYDDSSFWLDDKDDGSIEEIKPYLRPLSSMTEEEKIELCTRAYAPDEMKTLDEKLYVIQTNAKNATDFYNEHYFDYRGLIEKGLALEAPEGMYKH